MPFEALKLTQLWEQLTHDLVDSSNHLLCGLRGPFLNRLMRRPLPKDRDSDVPETIEQDVLTH